MRIGILARAEDRGIGIQTWEAYRHLPDTHALVVDPGRWGQGFPIHWTRYGASADVRWDDRQQFDEVVCRRWLDTVDVVYAVETFYDPRLIGWAREQGVATVLHTNPELHKPDEAAAVDVVWVPTPWRIDMLPGARLVPYPVATTRFKPPSGRFNGGRRLRVLHVAGRAAFSDRNGTKLVAAATPQLAGDVFVVSQDETVALGRGATRVPTAFNYWDLYTGYDVLLMPRRFGGLCLPVQEAKAAGLAVVMLDCSPNDWFEAVPIPCDPIAEFPTGSGPVAIFTAIPSDIAETVNSLSSYEVAEAQIASRVWAAHHSWAVLRGLWLRELEHAVQTCRDRASLSETVLSREA